MKDRKRLILAVSGFIIVLLTVMIAVISASFNTASNSNAHSTLVNAAQIYSDAVAKLQSAHDLSYKVTQKKEIIIGSEAFNEFAEQSVRFESLGTEAFRGSVTETLQVGDHTVSVSEFYADDTGYFTIENTCFSANISQDSYIARYVPAAPVTASLYGSITGYEQDNSYVINFVQASEIEPWIQNSGASFISSQAAVHISRKGHLEKTVYNTSYTIENRFVRQSVTVEMKEPEESPIQLPQGPFTPVEDPDAPRMLEIATGYLLELVSVTSHYQERIHCQAFGDLRNKNITINAVNTDTWASLTETAITLENTGNIGSVSTLTSTELCSNGTVKTTLNGIDQPVTDEDPKTVQTRCQDILVGTIILPQYIQTVSVVEDSNSYRIEFTANETFSALLSAEACATLYQNTEILREHAEDYKTDTTTSYLTISKATGLPIASGFHYAGIYTIDALPYRLEFSADQQYELLNDTASKAINAEAGA